MATAGGLRADFVKGPQTPHSTFLSRCSISLTLQYGRGQIAVDNCWGPLHRDVRVPWSVVSDVY